MQTASATTSNPLLVLLDIVSSPLLLFNAEGRVVFSNQAAKAMPCRPALLLGSDPNVRALVRSIAEGKIVLQNELRVEALSDNGIARLLCRNAPKPIAGLVAIAVSLLDEPTPAAAPTEHAPEQQRLSLQQIMELLRGELLPPIEHLIDNTASPAAPSPPAQLQGARELKDRLQRMVDLVNVFGEDVLIGDERLVIPDLVGGICQELEPLTGSTGVTFVMRGVRDDLPPVYGSQRLMRRAIFECLHNAVLHSRNGVNTREKVAVEIGFRASGQFLLLNIHNIGVLSAAALSHHAATVFRPTGQSGADAIDAVNALRIGLPLAQRILQLHGGRLRIEQDSTDELDVMLELPTGAPLRNTHHLDMLQAQIYAEDLSKLMARSRQRSTA